MSKRASRITVRRGSAESELVVVSPIDLISRLSKEQLIDVFGTRARVWEVRNRKRAISIDQIRKLHFEYGLSASLLIAPY